MASFHDVRELWGNQGGEDKVDVISLEPITMIVPPELQDLPRTITSKSSASSSAGGGSGDHRSSTSSSDSSAEETPSEVGGVEEGGCSALAIRTEVEWLCLKDGRARATMHHEVVDGAAMVKRPAQYQGRDGDVLANHFDAGLRFALLGLIFDVLEKLGMPPKAVVFRSLFLCRLCPSTSGMRWYYISEREKMMIFTNIKNKVARWKRQFIFIHDTQTERMNNELAACLSKWRTPNAYMNYPQLTVGDVDLKNQLLDHVKARGLVDFEALVTPEQLALLGRNEQHSREVASMSIRLEEPWSWDEHRISAHFSHCCVATNMPSTPAREVAEPVLASSSISRPRIAYPEGFNYVKTDCQAAMVQGMQSFKPPADRQRAKGHVQQHGGHAALLKLIDVNELREELEKAQVEKESSIQAVKEEVGHAEDRTKKAESNREKALYELNSLKDRVAEADQHITGVEASLEQKMDEQGKSLAPPVDTWVRLKWELNEEGLLEVPVEPSSTPPSSQPDPAPALSPPYQSSPARSTTTRVDASIPVDLTND
ncbi:hypothetical protein SLEP1_g36060 [Rubroshorea leprosula]|uniref:Uncharacterized protein n=1 Tax=Rubroshorea leprosula TaxID=152421 RepID=A0AAV5KQ93_9ROSI|nr:hypothetical protein SLEP1_g36060 [Rubroshorea leprosula]